MCYISINERWGVCVLKQDETGVFGSKKERGGILTEKRGRDLIRYHI